MAGKLEDFEYPAEKVKEALAGLPKVKVLTSRRSDRLRVPAGAREGFAVVPAA